MTPCDGVQLKHDAIYGAKTAPKKGINTSVINSEGGCYLDIIKTDIRGTRLRL
jgi:hypothetical protein